MGKGDKKTRKGKITMGSFGKKRPHNVKAAPYIPTENPVTAEKTKKPSA